MKPVNLVVHSSGALIIMDRAHLPILQNNDWSKAPVGVATCYIENGVLKAHCFFHSMDATYAALFPSASGVSVNRSLHIKAISIGGAPNVDKRIKSIGDQMEAHKALEAARPAPPEMTRQFTNVPETAGLGVSSPVLPPQPASRTGKFFPKITRKK